MTLLSMVAHAIAEKTIVMRNWKTVIGSRTRPKRNFLDNKSKNRPNMRHKNGKYSIDVFTI